MRTHEPFYPELNGVYARMCAEIDAIKGLKLLKCVWMEESYSSATISCAFSEFNILISQIGNHANYSPERDIGEHPILIGYESIGDHTPAKQEVADGVIEVIRNDIFPDLPMYRATDIP